LPHPKVVREIHKYIPPKTLLPHRKTCEYELAEITLHSRNTTDKKVMPIMKDPAISCPFPPFSPLGSLRPTMPGESIDTSLASPQKDSHGRNSAWI